MRGFFRSNTFKILLIVVLLLGGIWVLSDTVGDTSLGTALGLVTTPMQQTATAVFPQDQEKLNPLSRQELEEQYAQLAMENAQLREQLVDYYTVKQENRQYAQALKIKETSPELALVPAAVTGRDPADAFGGFTIDRGYLDNVKKNDPVITEKGVVGIVTEVYALSAKVTTIFSQDVKMGAIAKEFMESGVVTGTADTTPTGAVRMDYLQKETKVQEGTVITTSGAGGVFPKDLIIGRVSHLGSSPRDVSLYAVVQPFEDVKTVSDVFVIVNFPGKGQGENQPIQDGEAVQ